MGLLLAVFFICKWMALRAADLPSLDNELAKNHLQISHEIFSSRSIEPGDEAERAAKTIEVLSRARDLSRLNTIELRPDRKSKLHLIDDVIKTAQEIRKERFGIDNGAEVNPEQAEFTPFSVGQHNLHAQNSGNSWITPLAESSADLTLGHGQEFDWNALLELDLSQAEFPEFQSLNAYR